ncbi:MAG TPA: hypothetical protein VF591_02800 [Pyrinomonadaceae bacterium]|jgi:hypothetical protein
MTSHAPAIEVSHDQPPLPNQHFSSWLRGQTTLFISQIVAILGFISFIASLVYYVADLEQHSDLLIPETVKLVVDYTHVVFMALFVVVLIQVLDDNDRGSYRVRLVYERVFGKQEDDPFFKVPGRTFDDYLKGTKKQLKRFKKLFLLFWIGMLFLYVFFSCKHSYELATRPAPPPAQSSDAPAAGGGHGAKKKHFRTRINVVVAGGAQAPVAEDGSAEPESSEAARPESASPAPPASEPKQPDPHRLSWREVFGELVFPFIVFAFNNFTLLLIFLCFLVLHIPSYKMGDYAKYRNVSALIVIGLTLLYPALVPLKVGLFTAAEWKAYSSIFDTLSGVINAMVLALLIARLDSKLVGLPSWLISILYSYAAVQPLFLVFELSGSDILEQITTSVLIFVFVSKIYFFLIIIYALQTGKMLNYLFCFPILREHANEVGDENAAPSQAGGAAHAGHTPKEEEEEGGGKIALLLARCDRYAYERLGRAGRRLARARGRLSLWLRSERPLEVSLWLGVPAICYFFISLIFFLVSSNNLCDVWGVGRLCGAGVRVGAALSHLLKPDGGGMKGVTFNVVIDCLQLLFVAGMIATLYLLRKENRHGTRKALALAARIFKESLKPKHPPEKAQKQLKKFKEYFLYFWCVTFLLYVVFLLKHLKVVFLTCERGSVSFAHFLHAHGLTTDLLCGEKSIAFMAQILLYPFLEFLLGTLNLLFVFWCFVILRSPAFDKRARTRQGLLIHYSGFVVALLTAVFPLLLFRIGGPALSKESLTDYATVFDGVTGTLSAVVLALLIARMDSKLFGLPWWLIGMLFAYASIQPLFIAFALNVRVLEMVQTSVLTAAFGLKICFFLIVAHSLQGGKMLNYMVCFPLLRERVDSIFENQFEIRLVRAEHNSFTLSILKKNEPYYSTERRFKSRRACDTFVKNLRRRMEDHEAYGQPQEAEGTYWVEVRSAVRSGGRRSSAKGRLLCESGPLRSEDEAQHLIDESLDKIPYCKYTRV